MSTAPGQASRGYGAARLLAVLALASVTPMSGQAAEPKRSGFADMGPAVQAMQRDDAANPAMLWVADGEALWRRVEGAAGRSCDGCHGQASATMRGVAARYPGFDARSGQPVTLAQRINLCRQRQQRAEPLRAESDELLALETYVAMQSRGMPIAPAGAPELAPLRARGEQRYRQRIGQLDLSCSQCHDERARGRLGGSLVTQGHPVGYPLYRLEWQAVGSLERRIRGCMQGVRAEPYPFGSIELVELALYLAARATGLPVETPAVRP